MGLSLNKFFQMVPKLPYTFKVEFFTNIPNDSLLTYFVKTINIPKPDIASDEGKQILGNSYITYPIYNPGARKLEISFEETDDMFVTTFFNDFMHDAYFGGTTYYITIIVTQYSNNMVSNLKSTGYVCHISTIEEPVFRRDGSAQQIELKVSFIVDAEMKGDYQDLIQMKVVGYKENITNDLFAAKELNKLSDITRTDFSTVNFGTYVPSEGSRSGSGPSGIPPGKQLAATGGVGKEGVTHSALMEAAKAEFTGTNGANRTEGREDMVYFNSYDGGTQKLNFGMGNTQKYLTSIGLGQKKFTIYATIDGQKVTLTGTMEYLTQQVKKYGHANSSSTAWKMDEKTTKMVTEASMSHIATQLENSYDKEILAAMDKTTLGGLAHIEYGAGGSSATLGRYMNAHKEEVIAELKKNNGQFSDAFVNKMMENSSVRKVMYREWTIKEGKHAGERQAVDRRGRLTGKSGHSMRRVN